MHCGGISTVSLVAKLDIRPKPRTATAYRLKDLSPIVAKMDMRPALRSGPCSRTNLLYEGNFQKWQSKTSAAFIYEGRPAQAYPAISHISEEDGTVHYYETTSSDMALIQQRTTPALLRRVPSTKQVSVGQFYAYLENLCKPFRLLDLPAELRNHIYERGRRLQKRNSLAQATKQLREEVLPVYFSINAFATRANLFVGPKGMHDVLSDWKGRVLRNNAKSLKAFIVAAWPAGIVYLRFTFEESFGLQIECENAYLMPELKKMLRELNKKVQSEHEGQDLKGELILLAVKKFYEVD